MLGAIFVYNDGSGMFVSWKKRSMRDRFDLSAEQVLDLLNLECKTGIGRNDRLPYRHLIDTPEARSRLNALFSDWCDD